MSSNRNVWIIAVVLVLTAVAAFLLHPRSKLADARTPLSLEAMIPQRFGTWRIDTSIVPIAPAPDVQARLNKIYNQTLSRTYVGPDGKRIMVSIAYGGDQSDSMQLHRPEVCYSSQGFEIRQNIAGTLATPFGDLPVRRLMAVHGYRNEPITYWVVVGDHATLPGLRQKMAQLSYGLTGRVPDGFLVRISSIDRDASAAYGDHESFIRSMLEALDQADRARIAGKLRA